MINLKMPWPLPDITPFSRMQKIEVTGASHLAWLFLHQGCFCIAYQYFLWVVSVTLCMYQEAMFLRICELQAVSSALYSFWSTAISIKSTVA